MEKEIQSLEHSSVISTQSDTPLKKSHSIFGSSVSSSSNKVTATHYSISRKRKVSDSEDDFPQLCILSNRKSTGLIETSNFLRFLLKFEINLKCRAFCWGKAHIFSVAVMVRITLSQACLKCNFNVDHSWKRNYNRGRRSLPIEKASSKHQLHSDLNFVEPIPFQVSLHTPNHSSDQVCNGDITPYSRACTPKRFRPALPFPYQLDLTNLKSEEGFIDSHCHLDFLFHRQGYKGSYKDYINEYKSTFPDSYKGCLAIFCNPYSFDKKELWEDFLEEENVWASFGCHPHNAKDYNNEVEKSLRVAVEHPKVRALGEIGLDYSNRNNCLRPLQHEAFKRQLKIAIEKDLPLVIHCRNAHEDCMTIMKEIVPKEYLIHLHCFTDTWVLADKWLQEFPNLFIGITNVVTFPSAETVHEVARKISLDRLLLETDAPYFIPKPFLKIHPSTKYSHPGMAIYVAVQIAALREESVENVLRHTRRNTKRMYKI